jgi:hypothetical protein
MKPCNFGMDCEIHGSCYASYHGRPELCGKEYTDPKVCPQNQAISPFEETENSYRADWISAQDASHIIGLIVEAAGGTITVSQRAMGKSPHDLTLVRTDNTDGTVTFKTFRPSEQELD